MKKISYYLMSSATLLALPVVTFAQLTQTSGTAATSGFGVFVLNITDFINTLLVPAVMALAFLAFIWGMFKFFILGGGNEDSKEQGKQLMIWATLGFVMIIVLWGLVNFIGDSLGLTGQVIEIPSAPVGVSTPQ